MPHSDVTWRDRLRYRFENTLARGSIAIILWLALASAAIVTVAAMLLFVFGVDADPNDPGTRFGLIEGAWQALMRTLDAGNLASDLGWPLRLLMLVVTIGGIFIVSTLIGTITAGLEARLDELRKGHSRVIERNHTLILGWSSKVFSIIGELIVANQNQKNPRIVILADRDKVEMEDAIRMKFPDTGNTLVICRNGDPLDLDDLAVASAHTARSIIVLAPELDNPDIYVIKSVLAITNNPQRRREPYHIVAEIRDEANLEAAALVGGNEAIFIRGDELIARLTAQTCRQSGLSVVYTELLDFAGAEIYLHAEPALVGKHYRDALSAYDESAVFGLLRGNDEVCLNPPLDTTITLDDRLIAISADDDAFKLAATVPPPMREAIVLAPRSPAPPEQTLLLGGTDKAEAIIRELELYVAPGSEVWVVSRDESASAALVALGSELKNQQLRFQSGDPARRATLDALDVPSFNHVILLSYRDLPVQEADAQTLISLLHLRSIAQSTGRRINIVSEMMDLRNRALAQVARPDDFIVSDRLVSLMLSQLAENRHLDRIFRDLFSSEGAEIYIRSASEYVRPGSAVDFYTLIEAAAQRSETAIGYRDASCADDPAQGYGVRVNPKKSQRRTYTARDQLIVLAEN